MNETRRIGVVARQVGALLLASTAAAPAQGEERLRSADDYLVDNDAALQAETLALRQSARGEHRYARLERLAHDYVYGQGSGFEWRSERLLRRMRADGYTIEESLFDPEDGTAAFVVRDEATGRYTIAFRGTDDLITEGFSGGKEATYAEVGLSQYAAHHAVFDRWVAQYSREGRLEVTGHSLGGGLASILVSFHAERIGRAVLFQVPAQTPATNHRLDDSLAGLGPGQRPEIAVVLATPDSVALLGNQHIGDPLVILAHSNAMGFTSVYGHSSMLLQNADFLPLWSDPEQRYRADEDGLLRREVSYNRYSTIRSTMANTITTWEVREGRARWNEVDAMLEVLILDYHIAACDAGLDQGVPSPSGLTHQARQAACDDLRARKCARLTSPLAEKLIGAYERSLRSSQVPSSNPERGPYAEPEQAVIEAELTALRQIKDVLDGKSGATEVFSRVRREIDTCRLHEARLHLASPIPSSPCESSASREDLEETRAILLKLIEKKDAPHSRLAELEAEASHVIARRDVPSAQRILAELTSLDLCAEGSGTRRQVLVDRLQCAIHDLTLLEQARGELGAAARAVDGGCDSDRARRHLERARDILAELGASRCGIVLPGETDLVAANAAAVERSLVGCEALGRPRPTGGTEPDTGTGVQPPTTPQPLQPPDTDSTPEDSSGDGSGRVSLADPDPCARDVTWVPARQRFECTCPGHRLDVDLGRCVAGGSVRGGFTAASGVSTQASSTSTTAGVSTGAATGNPMPPLGTPSRGESPLERSTKSAWGRCDLDQAVDAATRLAYEEPDNAWLLANQRRLQDEAARMRTTRELLQQARSRLSVAEPSPDDVQAAAATARQAQTTAPACMSQTVSALTTPIRTAETAARARDRQAAAAAASGFISALTGAISVATGTMTGGGSFPPSDQGTLPGTVAAVTGSPGGPVGGGGGGPCSQCIISDLGKMRGIGPVNYVFSLRRTFPGDASCPARVVTALYLFSISPVDSSGRSLSHWPEAARVPAALGPGAGTVCGPCGTYSQAVARVNAICPAPVVAPDSIQRMLSGLSTGSGGR